MHGLSWEPFNSFEALVSSQMAFVFAHPSPPLFLIIHHFLSNIFPSSLRISCNMFCSISQTLSQLCVLFFKTHQVQFVLPKYFWVWGSPLWCACLTRVFAPPPSTQQLPGTSLLRLGVCAQLPSLPWKSGLSSHKPCACSQNHYDFMGAAPLLCVEDTVALYFPSICRHCVLSTPFSVMIPEF